MALQQAFKALVEKLDGLNYAVSDLAVDLEPNPMRDEPHLVQQLSDKLVPLEASAEEALANAKVAVGAAGYPLDIDRLRQTMIDVQRACNEVTRIYLFDLVFNSDLAELTERGGRRGDAWRRWGLAVTTSIARCRQPIFEVSEALFQCWRELVDRIGMNSVSVQTKAVGQEISVPAAELRKAVGSVAG